MKEEFYRIAFRCKKDRNDFFWKNDNFKFNEISFKLSSRYWIADPFIVEEDGFLYVFCELYDYFRNKGVIAYSKISGNSASHPTIIIEEDYHLSFPYIWKENGKYFIMPESSENSDLSVYEAVDFPNKWIKKEILINNIKVCDGIRLSQGNNRFIIASKLDVTKQFYWCNVTNILFKSIGNKFLFQSKLSSGDYGIRNAGAIIENNDSFYRPGQISDNQNYGHGLAIWKLSKEFKDEECVFEMISDDFSQHILLDTIPQNCVAGVHTYNTSENYEIIDFKYFKEFNFVEKIRNKIGSFLFRVKMNLGN